MDELTRRFRLFGGLALIGIIGANFGLDCRMSNFEVSGFSFAAGYLLSTGLSGNCPFCSFLKDRF